MLEAFDPAFTPADSMHDRLFNEIYSVSFAALGDVLFDMLGMDRVSDRYIEECQERHAGLFADNESDDDRKKGSSNQNIKKSEAKRREQAYRLIDAFLCGRGADIPLFSMTDDNALRSVTDIIPLTHIEIQWLDNILAAPNARFFLDDAEIAGLRSALPHIGWFDVSDVKITDQFSNVASYGENYDYVGYMRGLMDAIHRGKCVDIRYISQRGLPDNAHNCAPAYIEYSKKDNKFRLQAVCGSNVKTLNLERMSGVRETDHSFDRKRSIAKVTRHIKSNMKRLVVYFNDGEGVTDRILSEFSYYKKECIKWGNGKYRMTLHYVGDDYKEIIIRLLSYGSLITVSEDTGSVLSEMKERLEKQLVLSRIIENERDEYVPDEIKEIGG